jgi:hypothetical protein
MAPSGFMPHGRPYLYYLKSIKSRTRIPFWNQSQLLYQVTKFPEVPAYSALYEVRYTRVTMLPACDHFLDLRGEVLGEIHGVVLVLLLILGHVYVFLTIHYLKTF